MGQWPNTCDASDVVKGECAACCAQRGSWRKARCAAQIPRRPAGDELRTAFGERRATLPRGRWRPRRRRRRRQRRRPTSTGGRGQRAAQQRPLVKFYNFLLAAKLPDLARSFFRILIKSPGGKPKCRFRLGLPEKVAGLRPGLSRFKMYGFHEIAVFAKASAGLRAGLSRFKNSYVVRMIVLLKVFKHFRCCSFCCTL